MRRGLGVLGLLMALVVCTHGYYVPGTYPQEFKKGDFLQANVNSLSSFETEVPLKYYSMPFCRPPEGVKRAPNTANPGTILQGLHIENSPYNFTMKVKQTAQLVCKPDGHYPALTAKQVKSLKHKIDNHYRVNMVLDNLPVTVYDLLDEEREFMRPGFELGYKEGGKYYIHNHLVFNILVYKTYGEYTAARAKLSHLAQSVDARKSSRKLQAEAGKAVAATSTREKAGVATAAAAKYKDDETEDPSAFYMVVGFEVSPCSIKREAGKPVEDTLCGVDDNWDVEPQEIVEGAKIVYTYDVYWQNSNIKWTSRWDAYLRMPGGKVHWFSIMNSVLVVLVMASIVAMILVRTVRRDLAKYESMAEGGNLDMRDEAGWKLLTGDVFRAPAQSLPLAMHIGSGVQIISTALVTFFLATLGFLSPASRGALVTTTIVMYVWLAVLGGFVAVYVWGVMERSYSGWAGVATRTATFYPGVVLAIFTFINIAIKSAGSSGAVPLTMYFSIVAVWFLVSVPLTFVGGYLALRVPIPENPVKTNQIPRHIPPPPLPANPTVLFFAAGVLPFGTLFIELYFAMTSLWLGYFYYLFGFVLLIGLLTIIINAEISILCTYVQLCAEDYLWWWKSFQRGGSVAIYVGLYAIGFWLTSGSTTGTLSALIYLSYMSILITALYLGMGLVGWAASWVFVRYIFAAVKAD